MKKFFFILLILFLAGSYFIRIYKIDGTSMNYGLIEGDMVLTYRQFDDIHRGDMLVMKHPLDSQGRLYIKRCAALPGDMFFQKERSFYLQIEGNSAKTKQLALSHDLQAVSTQYGYFIKDPYLKYYGVVHNWKLQVPKELTELPLTTVSPDHYLMLGDFRDNSADSRFFGAVPRKWIFSKVIYVFKKPRNWMTLINIEEAEKE
ncbi:signal peptidase I [Sulfurovum sp.]|jgi:signal peptidase I|uniref:signal peptidase I n=1 Tax=Sulfurovum sp. TaxID=1969726 RepID=UPI0025F74F47|nr:signal peptidase I [Sulfurovum sp.]